MKPIEVAYAAGFFEGEGSLSLTETLYHKRGGHGWAGAARASQKAREPLEFLRDRFGGSIRREKTGVHYWTLYGLAAVEFLKLILPHLKASYRREEAIVFIQFYRSDHEGRHDILDWWRQRREPH